MKIAKTAFIVTVLSTSPVLAQVESYSRTTRDGVTLTKERLRKGVGVEHITCRQFNALEASFKPKAISYAVAYTKKGKPVDPMIAVSGVDKVTPVVVKDCRTRTGEPLLDRIKAAFHDLR